MSSIMRCRSGLMALSVMRDAPVLMEVANPSSQDRTPRRAIVLAVSSAAAPYRASGLVQWRKAAVPLLSGYGLAVPQEACSVVDLRDGPQFLGRGGAKAEEHKISWYLLEQHVGADLDLAATRPCCRQKWRDFLLHHDFADEGRGCNSINVHRQWVTVLHAERRRVDDDVAPGWILGAYLNLQRWIICT